MGAKQSAVKEETHSGTAHRDSLKDKREIPPELLPRIVSFLDPDSDKDRTALLALQRSFEQGWECVTPILYREVTVRDWTRWLRLPDGVVQAEGEIKTECQTAAQVRSMLRRWRSFTLIKRMTVHNIPLLEQYLTFRLCAWESKDVVGKTIDLKQMFPNLLHLQISSTAMEPLCHDGAMAHIWIGEESEDSEWEDLDIPFFGIFKNGGNLFQGCITLPAKEEHTMAHALMQLRNGVERYGEEHEGGMRVIPPNTSNSSVLCSVLSCFAPGSTISIHNMTDLWINLICGHRRQSFNLFYQSQLSFAIPHGADGSLRDYRLRMYKRALICEPENTDGTLHRSTWTINGEANCIDDEDHNHKNCYLDHMVTHLALDLLNNGHEDEVAVVSESEVDKHPEVLGGVVDTGKVTMKRMRFIKPGQELACNSCGAC